MTDGRRRRWVAHDVHFLDEPLGEAVFDRFGAAGVALWFGFIAACKRYHIEGSCSWASDVEALGLFGLPGMTLVDNDGEPFELGDWLDLLSAHKVVRRTVRGRRVKVVCTRWGRWQQVRNRPNSRPDEVPNRSQTEDEHDPDTTDGGQHKRRSDGENTDPKPPNNEHDSAPDLDLDLDLDQDKDLPPYGGAPNAGQLMAEHLEAFRERPPVRVVSHTAREVKTLLDEGIAPDHVRAGLATLRDKALHPSTLPSLVNEAMNPPNGQRPKASDDSAWAAGQRYAQREGIRS